MDIERHGIERLRWLTETDPDVTGYDKLPCYPRWQTHSPQQVQIECSIALIEELHDAIAFWSSPQMVIKNPP